MGAELPSSLARDEIRRRDGRSPPLPYGAGNRGCRQAVYGRGGRGVRGPPGDGGPDALARDEVQDSVILEVVAVPESRDRDDSMPDTARILIIDDDRAFRVGTGALLADEGYEVDAAPGGDAGLSQLREEHYDMVLLDLKMEGRTGLSVLEELRVSGNDVPVLMLTGYATVDSAVQALK